MAVLKANIREIVAEHGFAAPVHVTRPTMPPLADYFDLLAEVWPTGSISNGGALHQRLEERLGEYLGAGHVSLFGNGTSALIAALQSLDVAGGEVITTPFTFAATAHAIHFSGATPVFADVGVDSVNVDPDRIEACIGPKTKAILPVHLYGMPCDTGGIQAVADRHGLPVVYDAAHAFGVRVGGRSILLEGDLSVISFHATKPFSTVEGGAVVSRTSAAHDVMESLKNFGLSDGGEIVAPGVNGKMNELEAAFGLLQLDSIDEEIDLRRSLAMMYRSELEDVPGIACLPEPSGVDWNGAYFPVFVDADRFGMTRDELQGILERCNVFARSYFYPTCNRFPCYAQEPSANPGGLVNAERWSARVLCLPMYGMLEYGAVSAIAGIIRWLQTNG